MITAYTGTPGSGKTLDVMRAIVFALQTGRRVLCNIRIKQLPRNAQKYRDRIEYITDSDITPKNLLRYAVKHHDFSEKAKEYQTLVVIDECQLNFSDTVLKQWQAKQWMKFFSQHRKFRFNFLLVTQDIRTGVIRQVRDKVEIETTHWKLSNYPTKSIIAGLIFLLISLSPIEVFMSISQWMGMKDKDRLVRRLYLYKPMLGRMYSTYEMFDMEELQEIMRESEEIETEWKMPDMHTDLLSLPSPMPQTEGGGGDTARGGDPPPSGWGAPPSP